MSISGTVKKICFLGKIEKCAKGKKRALRRRRQKVTNQLIEKRVRGRDEKTCSVKTECKCRQTESRHSPPPALPHSPHPQGAAETVFFTNFVIVHKKMELYFKKTVCNTCQATIFKFSKNQLKYCSLSAPPAGLSPPPPTPPSLSPTGRAVEPGGGNFGHIVKQKSKRGWKTGK
jgi:hypothetical protein